jgi:ABC-type lipoprotein release transport system permease subunit
VPLILGWTNPVPSLTALTLSVLILARIQRFPFFTIQPRALTHQTFKRWVIMRPLLEIAYTGLDAVLLHPLRSLITVIAVIAVLLPYLVVLGLSKGIEAEALASTQWGADLYVSGNQFGRSSSIPLRALEQVRSIEGVTDVVPRVVGEVVLGKDREHAVVVGIPETSFPAWADCIEGELPQPHKPNELVIGRSLARRLNLKIGSVVPPFYHNNRGERLARVVGIFKADCPIWQAKLILTSFETATAIFDQPNLATDLLVWCQPGSQAQVRRAIADNLPIAIQDGSSQFRPKIIAKEDVLALLPGSLLHREGIFNLLFLIAFVVCILVVAVTSGLGQTERRREIGILKATGWQTDEVMLRGFVESLALSLAAACISLLGAWLWLRVLNGYLIASIVIADVEIKPEFTVPFQLTPVPPFLAFVLSLTAILTGTLYSSWRAATVPPREAMR